MNICQSLIEAASGARALLGSRREQVRRILLRRQLPDGGFSGKDQTSDLYYTGFAVLSLLALELDFDKARTSRYLHAYRFHENMDLAHTAAWIRQCRLLTPDFFDQRGKELCLRHLSPFRSTDGAWHHLVNRSAGSAYGCFLVLGAMQDAGLAFDNEFSQITDCIDGLRSSNGGYFNEPDIPAVSVPATAAAVVVRKILQKDETCESHALRWIRQSFEEGGCRVMPMAPIPDLLSTAVGLHALSVYGVDLEPIRQACLSYVDSLWNESVGFCANSIDQLSDPEYMFYGLLALGHLAE